MTEFQKINRRQAPPQLQMKWLIIYQRRKFQKSKLVSVCMGSFWSIMGNHNSQISIMASSFLHWRMNVPFHSGRTIGMSSLQRWISNRRRSSTSALHSYFSLRMYKTVVKNERNLSCLVRYLIKLIIYIFNIKLFLFDFLYSRYSH